MISVYHQISYIAIEKRFTTNFSFNYLLVIYLNQWLFTSLTYLMRSLSIINSLTYQMGRNILMMLTKSVCIKFETCWKMLKMSIIRNQSHLEEVQREDHQKNLQNQDQAKLQFQDHYQLILSSLNWKVWSQAKAIEKKAKIAKLLEEEQFTEKKRMLKKEVKTLQIQEKVAKAHLRPWADVKKCRKD